jgi:hypothetical protein
MITFFTLLFYTSLGGIVLLFSFKAFEQKTGKSIIPENFVVVVEKSALKFFFKVAHVRSYITVERLGHHADPAREKLVSILLKVQVKLNFYFSRIVDMVRGRGSLVKQGKSSSFLHTIAEYKNLSKGKEGEVSHRFM